MPSHKGQLYMKADCRGCKALQEGKCVLGYKIELEQPEPISTPGFRFYVPTETCPKPRAHAKLEEWKKARRIGTP